MKPTLQPTDQPTFQPSGQPTAQPSTQPSTQPTLQPTNQPSSQVIFYRNITNKCQVFFAAYKAANGDTYKATFFTASNETKSYSKLPTVLGAHMPAYSSTYVNLNSCKKINMNAIFFCRSQPSAQPIQHPTEQPTTQPTFFPTLQPSIQPTSQPSGQPQFFPTLQPSNQPTMQVW